MSAPPSCKFFLFDAGLQTAKRERELRGPLLTKNLKLWKASVDTEKFMQNSCAVETPVLHELHRENKLNSQYRFNKVIQVEKLLCDDECEKLIDAANNVGFIETSELVKLNLPEYTGPNVSGKNSATVLLVEDDNLANLLWQRLKGVIFEHAPSSVIHSEYSGAYHMHPVGICPLMRIVKYEEGQQFKPHLDGVDYDSRGPNGEPCRSRLTLALYLNKRNEENASLDECLAEKKIESSYTGGAFRFLRPPEVCSREDALRRENCTIESSKLSSSSIDNPLIPVYPHYPDGGLEISPDVGRAILFGQDEYHEGLPVCGGEKYMIQTSVMYELDSKGPPLHPSNADSDNVPMLSEVEEDIDE